jgi:hypothetical protein
MKLKIQDAECGKKGPCKAKIQTSVNMDEVLFTCFPKRLRDLYGGPRLPQGLSQNLDSARDGWLGMRP